MLHRRANYFLSAPALSAVATASYLPTEWPDCRNFVIKAEAVSTKTKKFHGLIEICITVLSLSRSLPSNVNLPVHDAIEWCGLLQDQQEFQQELGNLGRLPFLENLIFLLLEKLGKTHRSLYCKRKTRRIESETISEAILIGNHQQNEEAGRAKMTRLRLPPIERIHKPWIGTKLVSQSEIPSRINP